MENAEAPVTVVTPGDGLESLLEEHARWIDSEGGAGRRAVLANAALACCDLAGRMLRNADLAGADLRRARLNGADLAGANLKGGDLHGADFTDARLEGAVLEDAAVGGALFVRARLDGARFQGVRGLAAAQLRDASLEGVLGLTADDLAGADLTGVRLPAALAGFDRLEHLSDVAGIARPLYLFVLLVTAFILLTVFSTPDVSIFTNAPSAVMPNLSTAIPATSLFWIAPLILVLLYAYQQYYMTQLWRDLAGLPDVLPDGSAIERSAHPWLFIDLVRLRGGRRAVGLRETVVIFLIWGAVPATLLAIWWRYLPVRDLPVTAIHIAIVLLTVWGSLRLFAGAVTQLRRQHWRVPRERQILWMLGGAMFVISAFCHGLPWILDRFVQHPPGDGFAYPEVLGIKPKNVLWLTADLEDGDLDDTAMTRSDLRYAYAHRASLVSVNLKDSTLAGSDFQRADFTRALLEDVDLSNSNLDSARFQNACLRRARLVRSDLEDTVFTGAYLGLADLSYAYLGRSRMQYANLQGARLTGADFAGADLRGAIFNCYASHRHDADKLPKVQCADLTNANFAGADLTSAQFLGANLSAARNLTTTQLQSACGVAAQLPPELRSSLPDCGDSANHGIAPGALSESSGVNLEDNPCWHEMHSDFDPGPPTE
jgi:uncharacterized protein YjbI with pentapeptide repeats